MCQAVDAGTEAAVGTPYASPNIYFKPNADYYGASSLNYTVTDLAGGRAYNLASENYRHLEMFTLVAGIYVVLTLLASLLLAFAGRKAFRVKAKVL